MKFVSLVLIGFIALNSIACSSSNEPSPIDTTTSPLDGDSTPTSAPIPITTVNLPVANAPLDENAPFLMNTLAGYQLGQIGTDLRKTVEIITSSGKPGTVLEELEYELFDQEQAILVPTKRINYECGISGSLTVEQTQSVIYDSFYSHLTDVDSYIFSDCRFLSNPESASAENYQFNGSVTLLNDAISINRSSVNQTSVKFDTFTLSVPGGLGIDPCVSTCC